MIVLVQLSETSAPIIYENALNCYTKGSLYCVLFQREGGRFVHKYPVYSLFRIEESVDEVELPRFNLCMSDVRVD